MNIYVASSWRNQSQPVVVEALRNAGHEVYDFREDGFGFGWKDIDPDWWAWSAEKMRAALFHELADEGYQNDMKAILACDLCVLVMPCGKSAHLELGIARGMGKKTIVLLSDGEPELMWRAADHLCLDVEGVLAELDSETRNSADHGIQVLLALAQRELGDEAKVIVIPLDPLPAWTDLEGIEHPPMPVARVEIVLDGKSFGMEGPEVAAPGFVSFMAAQLKTAREASTIIEPPPGFRP